MKKKVLALAFVAAMTLGLAKTAGSNDWKCVTWEDECFGYALICGDGEGTDLIIQQQEMLSEWYDIFGC